MNSALTGMLAERGGKWLATLAMSSVMLATSTGVTDIPLFILNYAACIVFEYSHMQKADHCHTDARNPVPIVVVAPVLP